jgi:hypothetical protein
MIGLISEGHSNIISIQAISTDDFENRIDINVRDGFGEIVNRITLEISLAGELTIATEKNITIIKTKEEFI